MNTGPESPPPPPPPQPDALRGVLNVRTDDKAVQALAETQEENAGVKDDRREERFLWVCACVILFDCAVFMNAQNLGGPLIVGIIELLALVILARRLGVEEVKELVFGLIDRLGKQND